MHIENLDQLINNQHSLLVDILCGLRQLLMICCGDYRRVLMAMCEFVSRFELIRVDIRLLPYLAAEMFDIVWMCIDNAIRLHRFV